MGIYKIEHMASGDCYVGGSSNIKERWSTHRWELKQEVHGNSNLQKAWLKEGAKAFEFSILEIVESKNTLLQREQQWLDRLNPTFNILKTAGSPKGWKHTEESKAKIADSNRKRGCKPETRLKISAKARGRFKDPEVRAKVGE